MYGLAVNLTMSPSGHPLIINEISCLPSCILQKRLFVHVFYAALYTGSLLSANLLRAKFN